MKALEPLQTLLCLTVLLLDNSFPVKSSYSQPDAMDQKVKNSHKTVTVGENVTLKCLYENQIQAKLYWYKQSLENTQVLVSTYFDKSEFNSLYRESGRFTLDNKDGKNDLFIINAEMSDTGVYHCICGIAHQIFFLETITVIVKDFNVGLSIHQKISETIQLGRSVTLKCSVHTGSCDGAHRVYWFKQSEESAAVLYSNGGSSDQCGTNTDSQTENSCVYNLPIHNVSADKVGTYYCAVASCGQVLFGNGTRVKIKNAVASVLGGVLAFTSVLAVFLASALYFTLKKYKWQSTAPVCENTMALSTTANAQNQQENLHYAALSINNTSRRQRTPTQTNCVYSTVRQLNLDI